MAGTVESPLPRDWYGGFGERSGETGRWQHRNRAPDRLNRSISGSPAAAASRLNRRVMVSGCGGLPFSQQNSTP